MKTSNAGCYEASLQLGLVEEQCVHLGIEGPLRAIFILTEGPMCLLLHVPLRYHYQSFFSPPCTLVTGKQKLEKMCASCKTRFGEEMISIAWVYQFRPDPLR